MKPKYNNQIHHYRLGTTLFNTATKKNLTPGLWKVEDGEVRDIRFHLFTARNKDAIKIASQ